jgi:D-alanine-D-alanine ligase
MTRTIVGILRGGTSSEYDLSLKTGAALMNALPEDRYEVRDIFVDRGGFWHGRGVAMSPARALSQIDVALNAIHGGVGEDGSVARILEQTGIPHGSSSPLSSSLAFNKIRAREILTSSGVRMPQGLGFQIGMKMPTDEMARRVFERFGPPYIVKPAMEGASDGLKIAEHIVELPHVLADVLDHYGSAVVEEFIRGQEASVGVIRNFRKQDLYALPPARLLLPQGARHLEAEHHRSGGINYRVPSDFPDRQKQELMQAARSAHLALGLGPFSRSDFMVTPRRVYLLEVNSVPGLYPGASFPQMLESVGSSVGEFAEHSIKLARERHGVAA